MDKLIIAIEKELGSNATAKEDLDSFTVDAVDSDESLWLNFRAGDHKAYTLLLRKHANVLFSYGCKFSKDEDFVKDCIQDVFFELWNRREKISQAANVKAYLFKSLRLRIFREQSKWNNSSSFEDSFLFEDDFNIESHLIQEQTSKEIRQKLQTILTGLTQRQKEILYLHFFEDMDHDGIGRTMGLNRQSVYNLLYRSITTLRKKAEFINFF
ncbi:MAG: sigma-70 family RNA polymerase sigma factor [Sphingobacteriaceae bacterium]|nr:MAG: sigma-70 family RNA polymerase sigma factor [Sphingobacteriaceae bacterium]